ncbi:MAG: FHA domain-containing protein [Planctomycetota bacterium]|jgi:hypothetical protein|nr:FHA domain-containing protein [Planctomycetota bacterium]
MANFVLQIVDGNSKENKVALPDSGTFTIGRRPACELQISHDEKVSGQHCEIACEGDVVILRDLESTNGTRVDGKRIQEIPISHGDLFQVGQTTVQLIDETKGVPVAESDMGLRIDDALLARSKKRSPIAAVVLLLVIVGTGAVWWFFLREDAPATRKSRPDAVTVPGNLLPDGLAHFEAAGAEDWLPLVRGGAFARGAGASTGRHALRADLGGDGTAWAVAVHDPVVRAKRDGAYLARASFRTHGDVRVALRLCFYSKAPAPNADPDAFDDEETTRRFERQPELVVGSKLATLPGENYTRLECRGATPPGCEEVRIALVACLPDGADARGDEAKVWVDDISLVEVPASEAAQSRQVATRHVFAPDKQCGSLRIRVGTSSTLSALSVLPEASGTHSEDLAELLPLPASDLHGTVTFDAQDASVTLAGTGGGRLVLHVDDSVVGGGYMVRATAGGKAVFASFVGAGRYENVTGLYWGDRLTRVLLVPTQPIALQVRKSTAGRTRFVLGFPGSVELRLGFDEETAAAIRLRRAADDAHERGEAGKALGLYTQILRETPFDGDSVTKARLRRAELLGQTRQQLEHLRREFDEAKAFHYGGLYRELLTQLGGLDSMRAEFGPQIESFRRELSEQLQNAQRVRGKQRGERLVQMAQALKAAEKTRLARMIATFVSSRFADTDAAKAADELLKN